MSWISEKGGGHMLIQNPGSANRLMMFDTQEDDVCFISNKYFESLLGLSVFREKEKKIFFHLVTNNCSFPILLLVCLFN